MIANPTTTITISTRSSHAILSFRTKKDNITVKMGPKLETTDYNVNPNSLRAKTVEMEVAVPKRLLATSLYKAALSVLSYTKCFNFLLTRIM